MMKNKAYTLKCDSCNREFKFTQDLIERKTLDKNGPVIYRYFKCPHCGIEYCIDVTDSKIRQMIQASVRMQKKYNKYIKNNNSTKAANILAKLKDNRNNTQAYGMELRHKWL